MGCQLCHIVLTRYKGCHWRVEACLCAAHTCMPGSHVACAPWYKHPSVCVCTLLNDMHGIKRAICLSISLTCKQTQSCWDMWHHRKIISSHSPSFQPLLLFFPVKTDLTWLLPRDIKAHIYSTYSHTPTCKVDAFEADYIRSFLSVFQREYQSLSYTSYNRNQAILIFVAPCPFFSLQ